MAMTAIGGSCALLVKGVLSACVGLGMALQAEPIALNLHLTCMRAVTVGAAHSSVEHLALEKRSVFVDLIKSLSIRVINSSNK